MYRELRSSRKGKEEGTGLGDPLGDVVVGGENGIGERERLARERREAGGNKQEAKEGKNKAKRGMRGQEEVKCECETPWKVHEVEK